MTFNSHISRRRHFNPATVAPHDKAGQLQLRTRIAHMEIERASLHRLVVDVLRHIELGQDIAHESSLHFRLMGALRDD